MRLLIIEDNKDVVAALRRGLQSLYVVDVVTNGVDGLHHAEVGDYDLILLDLTLPDKDGLEICRELRRERNTTPILILTARGDIDDKVALLDAGADDYLTKPFSLEELKARIRALLRREATPINSSRIEVGDIVLNAASRTVTRQDQSIQLRRKEFDLLEYMMRNAGKPLTRQMILDHVWDMNDNLWTNAIDVHIKFLRDKVDRPFGGKSIKTVHGVGYKLEVNDPVVSGKRR
jgi:two-component system OmpR family response regulator